MERMAQCINILGAFCGRRDVKALTQSALREKYGFPQADLMVLFGGSILAGGEVLAQAMREQAAKHYVIVGGEGHTTEALRQKMHAEFPAIETAGLPEAQVFERYLEYRYGLQAELLECKSTNCGNNITFLLELLKENGIAFESIILTQDASMQKRMEAGLRKYAGEEKRIINFAAYEAKVVVRMVSLPLPSLFGACGIWSATSACCWARSRALPMMRAAMVPWARGSLRMWTSHRRSDTRLRS